MSRPSRWSPLQESALGKRADLKSLNLCGSIRTKCMCGLGYLGEVINLTHQQAGWLFNHLGHCEDVHKLHYKSTSSSIERIEVAKLCLLVDNNKVKQNVGKNLDDISLQDMVYSNDSQKDEAGSSNDASLDEKLLNTVLNDPVCPEDEANLEKAINKTAENLKDSDTPLLSEPELSTPILKRKRKVGPVLRLSIRFLRTGVDINDTDAVNASVVWQEEDPISRDNENLNIYQTKMSGFVVKSGEPKTIENYAYKFSKWNNESSLRSLSANQAFSITVEIIKNIVFKNESFVCRKMFWGT
ncbi:unnamed protein product [Owenia fusiformis]|uniref:Uncharacterized protein n=1 Tax=Owenia fusiformis TaxID=6347 RepID=A0A8S4NBI1_OWEFU|nr:unnamed protein product [Owenia fusiformis]